MEYTVLENSECLALVCVEMIKSLQFVTVSLLYFEEGDDLVCVI